MYFMSDPQALHVTRNVIPGKLGVDLHLHRVHIPLVQFGINENGKRNHTPFFFQLPHSTRNVINGLQTYFCIPHCVRNAKNVRFSFSPSISVLKNEKKTVNGKRARTGSFFVISMCDLYLAIYMPSPAFLCFAVSTSQFVCTLQ